MRSKGMIKFYSDVSMCTSQHVQRYKNRMLRRQVKTAQKVKRSVDCRIYDKEF